MFRHSTITTTEQLNCNRRFPIHFRADDSKQQLLCLTTTIDKKEKSRDWSGIQDDISRLIVSKLRLYHHHRNFASACKEWYRITMEVHGPFQEGFPFLLLPYNYDTQTSTLYNVFNSEKREIHFPELRDKFVHASSDGWLAVMHDCDFKLSLINPFTRKQVQLPEPPGVIETHHNKLREFAESSDDDNDANDNQWVYRPLDPMDPFSRYDLMTKLVVSKDGKMVAAIVDQSYKLIIRREGEESWTVLQDKGFEFPGNPKPWFADDRPFKDIMFFEGNLYAITDASSVIIVECHAPSFKIHYHKFERKYRGPDILGKYFVDCSGNLLLVFKLGELLLPNFLHRACSFELYKFEKDGNKFNRIYEIGDKSLFLGQNGSISVPATEIVGCRPSCIYFADNYHRMQVGPSPLGYQIDNGVFCLDDNSVQMFDISHSMPRWVTPAMWLQQKI